MTVQPGESVLDLFCGLGNFTLPLAKQGAQVVGVEGSYALVERGYENADLNNLKGLEFYCADLFKPLNDAEWAQQRYDRILLDPPRSGAIEVIQQIRRFSPKQIVYVSCNPATLARDSAELLAQGYQLKSAGVMDMFPHTAHVESMAVFEQTQLIRLMSTRNPLNLQLMRMYKKLLQVMAMLRDAEHGCPWDLEQTIYSLIPYTIEEVYEVVDAIERKNMVDLEDELGDCFLQLFLLAAHQRDRYFSFADVAETVTEKLIRRHPHVFSTGAIESFGESISLSPNQVVTNWEKIRSGNRD